jgi:hypothetical protein
MPGVKPTSISWTVVLSAPCYDNSRTSYLVPVDLRLFSLAGVPATGMTVSV